MSDNGEHGHRYTEATPQEISRALRDLVSDTPLDFDEHIEYTQWMYFIEEKEIIGEWLPATVGGAYEAFDKGRATMFLPIWALPHHITLMESNDE